jgi:hypothetical protein
MAAVRGAVYLVDKIRIIVVKRTTGRMRAPEARHEET